MMGKLNPVFGYFELASQDALANTKPPSLDHQTSVGRHPLQQPGRNQSLLSGRKCGHKGVERRCIIGAKTVFENPDQNFRIRHLGEDFTPVLTEKKVARLLVPQRQNAEHRYIMPRREANLNAVRHRWAPRVAPLRW